MRRPAVVKWLTYRNRSAFGSDRNGSVAIITAFAMLIFIASAALAIDVANFYYVKRTLQTSADLAAMAAAADIAHADTAATASVVENAYPASAVKLVETGLYTADASIAIGHRFVPQALHSGTAARVTLRTRAPLYFAGILMPDSARAQGEAGSPAEEGAGPIIEASAVAVQPAYASFAIGSRLVKIDGGILNALLGGLLGGNISLTAMDYQSLIDTRIDLFKFSDALATRASLTGVTYDSLVKSDVKAADIFGAMIDAERESPESSATALNALTRIADLQRGSSARMTLNPLVNFGPFGKMPVGSKGLIGTSVSALDLVTTAAEIANSNHQVQMALALGLPGIASAQLQLTIGERPVGTSWVTVGSVGASVHTAQTRLYLKLQLAGSGSVSLVNLPIYIEVASATATLQALTCKAGGAAGSDVVLAVKPALIDAWIGDITPAAMTNFSTAPIANTAQLVSLLGLASVSGRAHATMTNMSARSVDFTAAEIEQHTKKTTSTTDFVTSLLSSLIGDLHLGVTVIGLGIGVPGNLGPLTRGLISDAAPAIDQVIDRLLETLGIGLGQSDTWITGLNCNRSVLVN